MENPFGFIVINKPAGLTSHDCVNRLRKVFGTKKVGHGGTLDPFVTGVLPIAIGNATRLLPYLRGSKGYTGTIQLGTNTNTDDMQGEIIHSQVCPTISIDNLNNLMDNFRGEILQKPPIFSSVHIKGERAYKKARRGEKFDLTPKKINIRRLKIISWNKKKCELVVEVECSKGTYIRSLARDIGEKIGCGGCLKQLHRTKAYKFNENHSVLLPEKLAFYSENLKPKTLNPHNFLKHLSSLRLISEEELLSWRTGRQIDLHNNIKRINLAINNDNDNDNDILVLDHKNEIVGIAELDKSLTIKPKVVFNALG